MAARHYAQLAGVDHAFSLDMGGTSADIGTIQGGRSGYLSEFQVGFGIPISVTCVDVATLGAGGGSIAWIDKGGLLQVGPQSAGAEPGPIATAKGAPADHDRRQSRRSAGSTRTISSVDRSPSTPRSRCRR